MRISDKWLDICPVNSSLDQRSEQRFRVQLVGLTGLVLVSLAEHRFTDQDRSPRSLIPPTWNSSFSTAPDFHGLWKASIVTGQTLHTMQLLLDSASYVLSYLGMVRERRESISAADGLYICIWYSVLVLEFRVGICTRVLCTE